MKRDRKHPTIDDVAIACAVSKGTVSKALSNRAVGATLTAETRERIRSTAAALGYNPDWQVRQKARKSTGYIGMTYDGYAPLTQGVYELVPEHAALTAMQLGYRLAFVPASAEGRARFKMLCDLRVDGCLVLSVVAGLESFLHDQGIPAIAINELGDGIIPRVLCDEVTGATLLGEHLLSLGHRRMAFCHFTSDPVQLQRSRSHYSFDKRLDTLRRICSTSGGSLTEYVGVAPIEAVRRMRRNPRQRETVFICECHDDVLPLLGACREAGIAVPEAVSVACFNRVHAMEWSFPKLTAVEIPMREMAIAATRLLISSIRDGHPPEVGVTMIRPRLVIGDSTTRSPS